MTDKTASEDDSFILWCSYFIHIRSLFIAGGGDVRVFMYSCLCTVLYEFEQLCLVKLKIPDLSHIIQRGGCHFFEGVRSQILCSLRFVKHPAEPRVLDSYTRKKTPPTVLWAIQYISLLTLYGVRNFSYPFLLVSYRCCLMSYYRTIYLLGYCSYHS